jgi:hypothetical protein
MDAHPRSLPVIDAGANRDAELVRAGWSRRFTAAPPRLQEMAELYRSFGLEVHLEPLAGTDFTGDCAGCHAAAAAARTIYTREAP